MDWVRDLSSLKDFISLVIVHAPDEFPVEDYLQPHEQLNLEVAFSELRNGVAVVGREIRNKETVERLNAILEHALSQYRAGNDVAGAHVLHEFERVVENARS